MCLESERCNVTGYATHNLKRTNFLRGVSTQSGRLADASEQDVASPSMIRCASTDIVPYQQPHPRPFPAPCRPEVWVAPMANFVGRKQL